MPNPAFVRPDGGVSFVVCAAGVDPDAEAAKLAARPEYAGWTYVGKHAMPASRRFRDQWRHDAILGRVDVNLPGARQQKIAEIRAERDPRLVAADALYAKAVDTGTVAQRQAIATYRQQLRDMPTTVQAEMALLTSAADLEAYQPTWPVSP